MPSGSIIPTACSIPCAASAPRARANGSGSAGTRRSTRSPRASLAIEARVRAGGDLALLLRRHHGPRAARRHRPAAPRPRLFAPVRHHLHRHRLARLSSPAPACSAAPTRRRWPTADCVVIWGTNAVNTQVNVMTHAMRARKERGATIVVIDIYRNATMEQADMALVAAARHRRRAGAAPSCTCCCARASPTAPTSRDFTDFDAGVRGASGDADAGMGRRRSPACRSPRSRPSPGSSARRQAPISASATASPASATAPPTCMPRSACRR